MWAALLGGEGAWQFIVREATGGGGAAMAFHEAAGAARMSICSEIFGGVHPRSGKKSTSTTEMDGGISCGDRASALGNNGGLQGSDEEVVKLRHARAKCVREPGTSV